MKIRVRIHFVAENTLFGDLHSHNLREYYYGDADQFAGDNLNLIDGVLQFKFGEDYQGNRKFPIRELVELHDKFGSGTGGGGYGQRKIEWTYNYDLNSTVEEKR